MELRPHTPSACGHRQVMESLEIYVALRRRPRACGGLPPIAPSAWPRAQTRAAKSCGVRGSHFPALFEYFNLERKLVLAAFFLRVLTTMLYSTWSFLILYRIAFKMVLDVSKSPLPPFRKGGGGLGAPVVFPPKGGRGG